MKKILSLVCLLMLTMTSTWAEEGDVLVAPAGWTNAITNGNLAGDDVTNFASKEYPSSDIVGAAIVAGAGKDGSRGIVVKSADETGVEGAADWDSQFWIVLNDELPTGTILHVEFDFKASQTATASTQAHANPGDYHHWAAIGDMNFTTEWQHFSADVEVSAAMAKGNDGDGNGTGMKSIAFNLAVNRNAVDYYFDNFGVWYQAPKEIIWTTIIDNDARCFRSKEYPSSDVLPVKNENGEYVVNSPAKVADAWETQFWIRLPQTLAAGKKFKISFDYKASAAATVGTQAQNEPGQYIHWACIGDVNFTDGWQTFDNIITVPSECNGTNNNGYTNDFHSIAFNLSMAEGIDYYFKNIKVEVDEDNVAAEFDYPDPIYTVAGTEDLCGTAWNTRANVMTYDEEIGLFTWAADNITVTDNNKPEFKVVKDCDWQTCWPENNWVITPEVLGGEGTYSLIITFDPETKAIAVLDEAILDEVEEIAKEDGVAVGKLLAALDAYTSGEGTKADLQAAINQYKEDNKDQEKDETAKVATNGWKKFDGTAAGVCATQFAPAITTYDGREAQMAEVYETNGNRTGTIIYQDITGLTNGNYKVGFYGNAFSTSGRDGFECTMEDGATDVAYVFANEEKEYISARIATSTTENDFRTFDVEVTDGNIKLGMGKDTEKSTNWHTIQIYQLTWFTTAKEVYALDQTELAALITEAKALAADESKTNGKDALNAAIATAEEATTTKVNWYNIPEVEAIIANLKTAMDNFKKAQWFIDFAAGEYYVIHAQEGLKMAAGHDWGTRGIINEAGLDLTLTPYEQSRTVTFDSRVSNGGNSHFLGSNLYMDSSEWGWALEEQEGGFFYILDPDGGKYINIDNNFNLVLSDTPCKWIIVSKAGVRAALIEEMAAATTENPVDATGLIVAPNFNRNDARNAEAWSVSEDCTNKNLSGGNDINNCAESYHSPFTIMQTISECPAGFYQLTAQGFYRQDTFEGETPAAPVFFANEINGDVPAKTGDENGMSDASVSFTNGDYTIAPITFEVKDDGMMYIGITASTNTQWVIWDNFQLKYFGTENPTTGITTVNATVEQSNNGIYNLNGQKVQNLKKGLYIINGKKVVK